MKSKDNKTFVKDITFVREHYGAQKQILVAIEEMAELQKELAKSLSRSTNNQEQIKEEMVDVYVMLRQLMVVYDMSMRTLAERASEKIKKHLNMILEGRSDVKTQK